MDLNEFGRDVGTVLKHAFSSGNVLDRETKEAFERLYSDKEKMHAFEAILASCGLIVVRNLSDTSAVFLPADSDSEFVMKLEDVKKRLTGKADKQVHVAFAILAILATFYPNRQAINLNDTNAVRAEDVYATIRRVIEFAKKEKSSYGEDRLTSIAEEFDRMSDSVGESQKTSHKEYYVQSGFKLLEESGYVRTASKDGGRLPTEMMRMVVSQRMGDGTFQMGEILSRVHDEAELSRDV